MARTLQITDGTDTVDLLNTSSGFQLERDGWLQSDPPQSQIWRESAFAEGRGLISSQAQNVIETIRCSLSALSHDNAARQVQTLMKLARRAREYHATAWQTTPVYLQAQTTGETNARYALLFDVRVRFGKSFYSPGFDPGNYVETLTLTVEREPYWRDTAPGTLPGSALTLKHPDFPDASNQGTQIPVANYRDDNDLTHIYSYDASATAFSGNLIASSAFSYFEVSGSTPAAGDIVYFGSTEGVFRNIVLTLGTLLSATGYTYTWEYYNGSAWAAMDSSSDGFDDISAGLVGDSNYPTGLSMYVVGWEPNTNWVTIAINGVTAHWWRLRITAVTTWTTSPAQATRVVFNIKNNYIELANTALAGDTRALLRFRVYSTGGQDTDSTRIGRVFLGAKSRGLTNFISRLNAGGDNPAIFTVVYGTDTSSAANVLSPSGNHAVCTFATTTSSWRPMVTWYIDADAAAADFVGDYQVFAHVRPNGAFGTVGRFNLRLAASALTTTPNGDTAPEQCFFIGDTAVNQNDNTTNELIDLGRMTVPSFAQHANDKLSRLAFAFEGKCPSGTAGTLHIYQIILIPIDELAFVASSYNPRDQNLIAFSNIDYPVGVLEIDAGVLVRGARLVSFRPGLSDQRSLLAQWIVGGELPVLRPATQYRLFFLVSSRKSNDAMGTRESLASSSLVATIYSHDRWAMLRGSN